MKVQYLTIYRDICELQNITEKQNLQSKYFAIECEKGDLEAVQYLHNISDLNPEVLERGYQKACKFGHLPVIKFIESVHMLYHVNFSWYISSSSTPGNIEVSKYLLHTADRLRLTLDEQVILSQACKNGNEELLDIIMSRKKCFLDNRCLKNAFQYPELFLKIYTQYSDKFLEIAENDPIILVEYYCLTNKFRKFKSLIDVMEEEIFLTRCFYLVFNSGKSKFIDYIINKFTNFDKFDFSINTQFLCILKGNSFKEFLETILDKITPQKFDFTKFILRYCGNSEFNDKIFWIIKTYRDKIDFHKIVDNICCWKIQECEDLLIFILKNKYVEIEFIEKYVYEILFGYSISSNQLIHTVLSRIRLEYINKFYYMIMYSHKINILKEILNKDVLGYVNDF